MVYISYVYMYFREKKGYRQTANTLFMHFKLKQQQHDFLFPLSVSSKSSSSGYIVCVLVSLILTLTQPPMLYFCAFYSGAI